MLRFILVGGANTLCTLAGFYALASVVPARIAFTISYLAGLTFVVLATPRYVFAARSSWQRRLGLGLWYMATYGVGIGVISLLSASRVVVVTTTLLVTAPLSFAGARLLVARPAYRAEGCAAGSNRASCRGGGKQHGDRA